MPKPLNQVIHISPTLFHPISPRELRVHSVFEKALNLEWEDTLYTVSSQLSEGNHTIRITPTEPFTQWVHPTTPVWLDAERLHIGDRSFLIAAHAKKTLSLFNETFQLDAQHIKRCNDIEKMIKEKRTISVFYFDKNDTLLEQLMSRILEFLNDPNPHNALNILGLGPGLTPLGDDILFGHILGMNALRIQADYIPTIHQNLFKTSAISRQLLSDMIARDYTVFYRTFLNDFFTHYSLQTVPELLEFGATSGLGILTGFIYSLKGVPLHD